MLRQSIKTKVMKTENSNYKEKQNLANQIKGLADTDRWNNNSYFEIAFNDLGCFLQKIQKLQVFASKVAETISSSMNPYDKKVAKISDKQAWILACAGIENNITL